MKKYANRERGLKMYCEGKDVYGEPFHIQDTSHTCFPAIWIYHGENSEGFAVRIKGAKKLVKGLNKFITQKQGRRGKL